MVDIEENKKDGDGARANGEGRVIAARGLHRWTTSWLEQMLIMQCASPGVGRGLLHVCWRRAKTGAEVIRTGRGLEDAKKKFNNSDNRH